MATEAQTRNERIRVLDDAAWYRQLDEQAQRSLEMSADEFIERYRRGEFGDPDENPDVMWLLMLLPAEWQVSRPVVR